MILALELRPRWNEGQVSLLRETECYLQMKLFCAPRERQFYKGPRSEGKWIFTDLLWAQEYRRIYF
jgi:hypothetical protein